MDTGDNDKRISLSLAAFGPDGCVTGEFGAEVPEAGPVKAFVEVDFGDGEVRRSRVFECEFEVSLAKKSPQGLLAGG